MDNQPWNINIHYDGLLESKVPQNAHTVLDVGCGDGFLAVRLAQRVPDVMAVDIDEPVLDRAQIRFPAAPVNWIHGDVMSTDLPAHGFDAVVSNAALHHFDDTGAALTRFAFLVRPGGTVAVATFVKPSLREIGWHIPAWVACAVVNQAKGKWEHSAPIKWPPPETFGQLRTKVRQALPGATVRRLLYGRALITWHAPV